MTAAGLRDTAVDLLHGFGSLLRARLVWLLLAAAIGYSFGYHDAFRGPESLGWKAGDLVDRLMPDALNEARQRNAEAIRQRVHSDAELTP